MSRNTKVMGVVAAVAAVTTLATAGAASADVAPRKGDVVGVGSDTVQNITNFIFDGDAQGDTGYNTVGNVNRVFSFDATPDANDRAGYLNGSATGALKPLSPTIVLKAGTKPVLRPNGSGSGINALIADKGTTQATQQVNFVRMSRLPNATENANVPGGLHTVRLGTEDLRIATASTSNAPAAITTAQLVDIYKCSTTDFATIGGTAGTITPQIPQPGSGTRSTFLADLKTANGGTDVALGTCVQTVEENDPTTVAGNPNAIVPFSSSRKDLYDGNATGAAAYFNDPTVPYGTPAKPLASGIKLLTGANSYDNNRGLFVVFRQNDLGSTTPFQPGGTQNFATTLFVGSSPYVASPAGQALIAAGGATPAYKDCPTATSC